MSSLDIDYTYFFSFNDRYDIDGKALRNTARYINHSCHPNCEVEQTVRTLWIVALRAIRDGEELTYNYGSAIQVMLPLSPDYSDK
jgi:SET domain-containing protein